MVFHRTGGVCGVISMGALIALPALSVFGQQAATTQGRTERGAAVRVAPAELTVLHSDSRSLVFEYRPHFTSQRTFRAGGREFTRIDFADAVPARWKDNEGTPDLRTRNIAIVLPASKGNAVRVTSADYEEVKNVLYAPVPKLGMHDRMLDPVEYPMRADRYTAGGFTPDPCVVLGPVTRARSLRVGQVKVSPLQYNPAARVLRKYSRLTIEVSFGTPDAAPTNPEDVALFKDAVLNPEILRSGGTPTAVRAKVAVAPSVLASGDWYRLTVADEGIYKLDQAFFNSAGINVSGIDPRTIKIFGNGGTEVPEDPTAVRQTDLTENAIYVQGESDGKFDPADFVLFYGKSARGWRYDAPAKTLHHYINHYSEVNYYWLTFGGSTGKRMQAQASSTTTPDIVAEQFNDGIAVEEEKVNILQSGKDWYGRPLAGPTSSFTYVNQLPGLVTNSTIRYRYTLVAHADVLPTFTVREGGNTIGQHTLNVISGYDQATAAIFEVSGTSTLSGNTSQVSFTFSAPSQSAEGWVDWLEILYPRMLWGSNEYLRFRSPDITATVAYRLQQFSSQPFIFNVTVPENVRLIQGVTGSYQFAAPETAGTVSEYCAAGSSAWKTPTGVQKVSNQNLRGYADGGDFIIVTSQEFRSAADRLKAFRETPEHGGLKTYVADVAQIYNEFGGGLPDITAIRDYLKYAYDNWQRRPQFVLLLGQGSYDYKSILGTRTSYVPTWESPESRNLVDSYASDDFFVKFSSSDNVYLVLGRLNTRSTQDAETIVDKIIRYDQNSVRDSWKMRLLFVGDDAWTPEGGEVGDGTQHSDDAETLASSFYTPDEFEKRKIYIAEYPTVNMAQGRRKPGAYQAIIDQINEGALILNYSGHGNQNQWAHEDIFEVQTSIPQLFNQDKLPLFVLATCNFSQFDDPASVTGSEVLLERREGGGIAVISATREVYAGDNAILTQGTYQRLFSRDTYGRVVVQRPATALYLYKAAGGNGENDQKFFFMGDPTMQLQYPALYASIDSVNHQAIDSLGGGPRVTPIQLQSLGHAVVSGTVRGKNNLPDPSLSGTMSLLVNDASRTQTIIDFYPGVNWSYTAPGGTIYRGENSIANGKFNATFIVPKDISYADTASHGRLVAYFSNGTVDGAAYTGNIRVGGTDSSAVNNLKGPQISLYLNNRSFRPGDLVTENPTLLADLADSSGINTSGAGIGHRIEVWINNAAQSKDVTDFYVSKLDNFREGTVQYPLTGLPAGLNTIRVRAWDSFNNSTTSETEFLVAESDQLTISDVFNYPNPFSSGTSFTFRQNQSADLSITVKIYTLAGRLIQTLNAVSGSESFVRVPWDGRDRDGDILANGVYFYKLIVRTLDGKFTSEALGKMAVLK